MANIGQENVFYHILHRKNVFVAYKNKKFKNSKNWHFPKGVNPWFWSKSGRFSTFFGGGNIGQVNVFSDILNRKNAFVAYKKKKLKSQKTDIFLKGLTHGFGLKMAVFPTFIFYVI